ncbi:MAG: hypothetical protein ACOC3G_08675, partial [Phycisphaeraceae bacterium]
MLTLTLAGCAAGPSDSSNESSPTAESRRSSSASEGSAGGSEEASNDGSRSETAEIAARRAREMAEAMSRGDITGEPTAGRSPRAFSGEPAGGAPEVRWSDAPHEARANADDLPAASGSS